MDLDLDIVGKKPHTVKINNEIYEFKDLTVEESLIAEFDAKELENMPVKTREDIKGMQDKLAQYIVSIIDMDEETARNLTMNQFKAIRKLLGRIDLYDQGFNDREIDKMEKDMVKQRMSFQGKQEE